MYTRMNRYWVGNVGLVLFIAFLSFIFLGTAGMVGKAEAAAWPGTGQNLTSKAILSNLTNGFELTIDLRPLTSATFDSAVLDALRIADANGNVLKTISGTVYGGVYDAGVIGKVYASVYNGLLTLTYVAPSGFTVPANLQVVSANVYANSTLQTVYLDLFLRPPAPQETGGTVPAPTPTPTSDAGTVVVDKTSGTVTVEVQPEKVDALLAKAPEAESVVIDVPAVSGVTVQEKAVEIPATTLDKVADKGKDLVVNTGEVAISLPPAAVDVKGIAGTATDAKLKVSARVLKDDEIQTLVKDLPARDAENLKAAGKVVEIELKVVTKSQVLGSVTTFNKPVEVAVNYDSTSTGDTSKLGVYRADVKDGQVTWVYVGGKVDKTTGRVIALLRHFSKYAAMAYSRTFTDIAAHWAKADIELMASRHVARGVGGDIFRPEGDVTRAEFAALLQRTLLLPEVAPAKVTFADVKADAWYFGAVEAAAQAGLVLGYEDGTFRPEIKISREEMATMISRALKAGGKPLTLTDSEVADLLARFGDAKDIQSWAKANAAIAIKAGIIRGRSAAEFAPKTNATRAEGVTMLKRVLSYLGEL